MMLDLDSVQLVPFVLPLFPFFLELGTLGPDLVVIGLT